MKASCILRKAKVSFHSSDPSPYAAALKHVALRGGPASLGPSSRELEKAAARSGALEADYRPPKETPWDDTVERWAYAWQFPLPETSEPRSTLVARHPALEQVRELIHGYLESPPSKLPPPPAPEPASISEPMKRDSSSTELPALPKQSPAETLPSPRPMMPAADFAKELQKGPDPIQIPVAYINDGSPFAQLSQRLGEVMIHELELGYDNSGISTTVSALGKCRYTTEAEGLVQFAQEAGFDIGPITYAALMEGFARLGDTPRCMSLIEKMKEQGITPVKSNWHMLMLGFRRAGDPASAIQVIEKMKALANLEPDELTFVHHLRALAEDTSRESNTYEAIQLFDQMENVYGYLPTRSLYHALLQNIAISPKPEMQTRLRDTAEKMELVGMPWDGRTYALLLRGAATVGDTLRAASLCAKMRDEGLVATQGHLSWIVETHASALRPFRANYTDIKKNSGEEGVAQFLLQHVTVCFGLYDMVSRNDGSLLQTFANALLGLTCTAAGVASEELSTEETSPSSSFNLKVIVKLEQQARLIWKQLCPEGKRTPRTYAHWIGFLASQQCIDEAESAFRELVLNPELVPTRYTYESLVLMHLASGEEGGTSRALRYLEAMERCQVPIRKRLLHRMKEASEKASYIRDMKRRARRIRQAREEYLMDKQRQARDGMDVSTASEEHPGPLVHVAPSTPQTFKSPSSNVMTDPPVMPKGLPADPNSHFAWWQKWLRNTVSKHELFEDERPDGLPRGESPVEKNEALRKLGIEPTAFQKKPSDPQSLLNQMRADGSEPAGALWSLDGGDLQYPNTALGPESWGATFWRERRIVEKELARVRDGTKPPPTFSKTGSTVRTAPEQLLIEKHGLTTADELAGVEGFGPEAARLLRKDEKDLQVVSLEEAKKANLRGDHPLETVSGEFVWQAESRDPLGPFRTDREAAELASEGETSLATSPFASDDLLSNDNAMMEAVNIEAISKAAETAAVLREGLEDTVDIRTKGNVTRRTKYDHLAQWREMYRHGTLELPVKPLERFGRRKRQSVASAASDTNRATINPVASPMAQQVSIWLSKHGKTRQNKTSNPSKGK